MKIRRIIIATLLVAVAATVAFVSCKKENQEALQSNSQPVKTFTVPQIDDMNSYFKDFRQKMEKSQNGKDTEYLGLDEAAWHLSSLANIDFCRINVDYDDFLFDTIEMQVNVTNGIMPMTDLCMAYEQMCTEIQQFKKSFNRPEQNMYFIKVSISTEGIARIAMMTSYTANAKDLYNHQWYFSDVFEAVIACDEYFSSDSTYYWNTTAARELQRVLNLFEHHDNTWSGELPVVCYIPTRDHTFNYTNTHDPYGSEDYYINDSRVFAKKFLQPDPDHVLEGLEMCYCLDSYLGLGYDYISDHLYVHEFPVNWTVTPFSFSQYPFYYIYHNLHVEYGRTLTMD